MAYPTCPYRVVRAATASAYRRLKRGLRHDIPDKRMSALLGKFGSIPVHTHSYDLDLDFDPQLDRGDGCRHPKANFELQQTIPRCPGSLCRFRTSDMKPKKTYRKSHNVETKATRSHFPDLKLSSSMNRNRALYLQQQASKIDHRISSRIARQRVHDMQVLYTDLIPDKFQMVACH